MPAAEPLTSLGAGLRAATDIGRSFPLDGGAQDLCAHDQRLAQPGDILVCPFAPRHINAMWPMRCPGELAAPLGAVA